ncbi:MAG: hypothetical protein HZA60_00245, partial [Deltaproteobacteria bacterium]|nr:hypothetical protein [Deltaproteobacteria bacterium]
TLDPMANTCIPHPVSEIVRNPGLAGKKERPDGRYLGRGYHLYDTKFWYRRVRRYATRASLADAYSFVEVGKR